MVCRDVPGVDWVRLREVHLAWGGPHGEYDIRKANNRFEAMKARGRPLSAGARLARAVFQIKFSDARRPRSVTIRPPNVALYRRDEDSLHVEQWIQKRGFLDVDDGEALFPILAGP